MKLKETQTRVQTLYAFFGGMGGLALGDGIADEEVTRGLPPSFCEWICSPGAAELERAGHYLW